MTSYHFSMQRNKHLVALLCLKIVLFGISGSLLSACSESPGGGGIGGSGVTELLTSPSLLIGQVDAVEGGTTEEDLTAVKKLSLDGMQVTTDQAIIFINGELGILSDIQVGMPVAIEVIPVDINTNLTTAHALKIEYLALVAGPVEAVSDDQTSMTIFSQTVSINDNTFMDGVTVEDIFDGQKFEVSGSRSESSEIVADYIRPHRLTERNFLVGQFSERRNETEFATLSGTPVDFRSIRKRNKTSTLWSQMLPGSSIVVVLDSRESSTDPLVAVDAFMLSDSELLNLPSLYHYDGAIVVTGVISPVSDNGSYKIRGVRFSIDDETKFRNSAGLLIDPLSINKIKVARVSGIMLGDGVLLATQIKIKKLKINQ